MPSSQSPSIAGSALDPTAVRPAIDDAEIIRVEPDALYETLAALRSSGMSMLLDIGGVDYLERVPRYDVVYHLLAMPTTATDVAALGRPRRVRVLVGLPADEPSVASVVALWPSADWAEREVYDFFGITFAGHPDLRRIQMPQEWQGHPLRKDYPLRGPAAEAAPRPPFASKSNVPAGTPPSSKVAAALQKQLARMQQTPPVDGGAK